MCNTYRYKYIHTSEPTRETTNRRAGNEMRPRATNEKCKNQPTKIGDCIAKNTEPKRKKGATKKKAGGSQQAPCKKPNSGSPALAGLFLGGEGSSAQQRSRPPEPGRRVLPISPNLNMAAPASSFSVHNHHHHRFVFSIAPTWLGLPVLAAIVHNYLLFFFATAFLSVTRHSLQLDHAPCLLARLPASLPPLT